jgi:membrane-associated HD superfamily phosphohydrolase
MIDLLIFTAIGVIADAIIGLNGFFGIRLYIALSVPLILLCYVRWKAFGLIPNLVIVIAHVLIYGANNPLEIVIAHSIGMLSLSGALLFQKWKPFRTRKIAFWAVIVYYLGTYLGMLAIEYLALVILNAGYPFLNYAMNQILNLLLGLGLMIMIGHQKDMLVSMNLYFLEKALERNKGNPTHDEE